jgi:hypothetical protein
LKSAKNEFDLCSTIGKVAKREREKKNKSDEVDKINLSSKFRVWPKAATIKEFYYCPRVLLDMFIRVKKKSNKLAQWTRF